MSRLVVGTSSSETVWAITGVTPTAATAIRPIMVENLVIFTLFEKQWHAPYQRIRPMVQRNPPSAPFGGVDSAVRSAEHTSELKSLMRISYAVFCLNKNTNTSRITTLNYPK